MKTLTCRDLGGPCDTQITGNSFEEIGQNSHTHVMEQINQGDQAHLDAANKMKNSSFEEQKAMMSEYKNKYEQVLNN